MKNMESIKNLVVSVSQNTKFGKLQKMVGVIDDRKFILTGFDGETFLLGLKNDADVMAIFNELEKARD